MVGDQDLAQGVFFRDFGSTVTTADGRSAQAHFDYADEMETFGNLGSSAGQIAQKPQITLATGALKNLANGMALTVDGANYKVRTARAIGDGKLTVVELVRA
jgi:hypothetical protein